MAINPYPPILSTVNASLIESLYIVNVLVVTTVVSYLFKLPKIINEPPVLNVLLTVKSLTVNGVKKSPVKYFAETEVRISLWFQLLAERFTKL